jgi:hypothetical protein
MKYHVTSRAFRLFEEAGMRCSVWISPIVLTALALRPVETGDLTLKAPLPFRLTAEGSVIVQVMLNDAGTFPFLLDTGSSQSAISESLAHHVDATRVSSVEVVGVVGREMRPVARLLRVAAGRIRGENVEATILPDARFRSDAYVGIIGQDLLQPIHYTVDYRKRQVVWEAGDAACVPRAIVLPLVAADGRFLVELPQRDSTLRMVPDSGAQGLVFYERGTNTLPRLYPTTGHVRLDAAAGHRVVPAMLVGELRIGTERLRLHPAFVVERRAPGDVRGDGVLPLHIFSRVTFNGPARWMAIEP